MNGTQLQFEYNGYQYRTYDDYEEDNIKTFHYCYRNGREIRMPRDFYNHSPYSLMTREQFINHCQSVEAFLG